MRLSMSMMRLPNVFGRPLLVAAAFLAAGASPAWAQPVFGPLPFVKTAAGPQVFEETFTSPSAGRYALWVLNGDEGGRVQSGTITIGGVVIVSPADFRRPVESLWKPVGLLAGRNALTVQLRGEPGSWLTVAILPDGQRPDLTVGRLVLPWGASSAPLVLSLKNGSHAFRRFVKVSFYDPSGELVAESDRLVLDPRASLSRPAADLVAAGSWTEGSIEIFYAGPDGSRVFATAALTDPATATPAVVVLPHAGVRHHVDLPPPSRPRF